MIQLTYREALRESLRSCLTELPDTFLIGEDVGRYGGAFGISRDLLSEFGEDRIMDAPLSELGFVGAGIGAALAGLKPIVEIMTVNFSLLALDQIINNAATINHMSGGQFNIPLVIRSTTGAGRQLAAQHSHSWEGWLSHIPGLKIVTPATIDDARYMLRAALLDDNPVMLFENMSLFAMTGSVSAGVEDVALTGAAIRRPGKDLVLITYGGSLPKALAAADQLAKENIDAQVLDLRSLRPLDDEAILEAVRLCGRAMVIDEDWPSVNLAAEVSARIMERAFYDLDAPVLRVAARDVPIPYAKELEEASLPRIAEIVNQARVLVGRHD